MLIYGHRGSSGTRPENTLAAFRQAMADGADGVEFDVRATADGVPVLLHDRDVARTTNGRGLVDELTLMEVQRFDAGQGERVPTLAEAVNLMAGRLRLDIEVKQAGIEAAILHELRGYPTAEWAISSFDWDVLRAFRALDARAELWPLTVIASDEAFAVAEKLGSKAIALAGEAVTAAVMERLDAADLDAVVWTVNRVEDARLARQLGVAVLITDDAGMIRLGLAAD